MRFNRTTIRIVVAGVAFAGLACGGAESGGTPTSTQSNTPTSLTVLQGDNQVGLARTALAVPVQVVIKSKSGAVVAGATVTFTPSGGGSVSPASAVTDANGIASTTWTLGPNSAQTLVASTLGVTSVTLTATIGSATPTIRLVLKSSDTQAAFAGTAVPSLPSVQVVGNDGVPLAGATVSFSIILGGGTVINPVVTTGSTGIATAGGWVLGSVAQVNTLNATATSGALTSGTTTFTAAGCTTGGATTTFDINVCFRSSMSETQRTAFLNAAAKWSRVVTSDLPVERIALSDSVRKFCSASSDLSLNIDDLLIFATVEPIDGKGSILGSASICDIRDNTLLPAIGFMRFDSADLETLEADGTLSTVILHEMGHVLGIGTLWPDLNLLKDTSTKTLTKDTYFSGTNAIAAFDAIGGTTYAGAKVPVENTGSAGSVNSHWRESVLKNELMTPFLTSNKINPLSLLTVRSLQDLGYTVNIAEAEPFSLSTAASANLETKEITVEMVNDIEFTPRFSRDAATGRWKRIQ